MLSLFCGSSASLLPGWRLLDLLSAQNRALPVPPGSAPSRAVPETARKSL